MDEQDCHRKHEEQRASEADTHQLLLKSNQLVGEVNDIISGEMFNVSCDYRPRNKGTDSGQLSVLSRSMFVLVSTLTADPESFVDTV